jgi:hypothetical protein
MDGFGSLVPIGVAVLLLYLTVVRLVRSVRELRSDRRQRFMLLAMLVAIVLLVGSCVTIERITGISPHADPPSYTTRRLLGVVFFVGYIAFVWVWETRRHAVGRREFFNGKPCPACKRPLQARRTHEAVMDGSEEPSATQRLYRCECGESTL